MDRHRYTRIGHGAHRRFWNPVPDDAIAATLRSLPLRRGAVAVDVGCGRGEALAILVDAFGARGLGIDPHAAAVAHAGLPGTSWIASRFHAEQLRSGTVDVIVALGALPWPTVAALRPALRDGGRLVVGDGVLHAPASAAYAEAFGELPPSLPGWRARAGAAGFRVEAERLTTQAEWDRYEEGHAARIRAWCDDHADDPDAPRYRARVDGWHALYRGHGRGVLGFGLFTLAV